MKTHFSAAIRLTVVLLIGLAVIYPMTIWALAHIRPGKGEGQTFVYKGKKYYRNIGQQFNDDHYFNGRPSATGYNAAGSGGSNKGPSDSVYLAVVSSRIDSFLVHNPGIQRSELPVELVTASGSGLDPDLSPAAAKVQIARIARLRGIAPQQLEQLIEKDTQGPLLGLFGPQKINVLQLNIDLDQINNAK